MAGQWDDTVRERAPERKGEGNPPSHHPGPDAKHMWARRTTGKGISLKQKVCLPPAYLYLLFHSFPPSILHPLKITYWSHTGILLHASSTQEVTTYEEETTEQKPSRQTC